MKVKSDHHNKFLQFAVLKSLTYLTSVLHTGNETTEQPLPFMSPYTKQTSGEINKQINRELFAHYTYLSMVRNGILCLTPVYPDCKLDAI